MSPGDVRLSNTYRVLLNNQSLRSSSHPSNRRSEGEKWWWLVGRRRGGVDRPEQTSQWGVGSLYGSDSQAASSFTSTSRGEGNRQAERGRRQRGEKKEQRGQRAGAPKHQRLLRPRNEGAAQLKGLSTASCGPLRGRRRRKKESRQIFSPSGTAAASPPGFPKQASGIQKVVVPTLCGGADGEHLGAEGPPEGPG